MGPPKAADVLRQALSVGADKVCLITDRLFGGADTLVTSYTLSSVIRKLEEQQGFPFDVVFCGKQSPKGYDPEANGIVVKYNGKKKVVKL